VLRLAGKMKEFLCHFKKDSDNVSWPCRYNVVTYLRNITFVNVIFVELQHSDRARAVFLFTSDRHAR
jgi:hypothetical protein